ncbi:MAG TPA: helix-turn-helix domain-containing GNAT family N-acetyltransferase [Steroidobacteraceae bacterium]|nr:helix-turn-helix domain-containing GNAT family N-acetyltransferase [Steroidobacteraceae bacterium]
MRSALHTEIAAVRRFNRFYTRRIALLDERLLDSPFNLTQARVLFELGTQRHLSAGKLVRSLGLDPGYLSRILQDFEERRLITRRRAAEDARRAQLALTAHGRRAFTRIDEKSRRSVGELLAPLAPLERSRLLGAMRAIESRLSDEPREHCAETRGHPAGAPAAPMTGGPQARARVPGAAICVRPYRIGDVGWAIERHGRVYAEEYGWNGEFEALVATLFARFATGHDPDIERFWVAEVDGERAGCVFVARNEHQPRWAQLRCLLVEPAARGLGLGRRLVDECIAFARSAGYEKMILWTNDVLAAARRIYVAAGFSLIEESAHHSFGKDLVGQTWRRDL